MAANLKLDRGAYRTSSGSVVLGVLLLATGLGAQRYECNGLSFSGNLVAKSIVATVLGLNIFGPGFSIPCCRVWLRTGTRSAETRDERSALGPCADR